MWVEAVNKSPTHSATANVFFSTGWVDSKHEGVVLSDVSFNIVIHELNIDKICTLSIFPNCFK